MRIEYDGTNFVGWQSQKNGDSVQDNIEKVWRLLTGYKNTNAKLKSVFSLNIRMFSTAGLDSDMLPVIFPKSANEAEYDSNKDNLYLKFFNLSVAELKCIKFSKVYPDGVLGLSNSKSI